MRERDADGEHEHTEPWRPIAELLTTPGEHLGRGHADRLDTGEDPEREQRELYRAGHEPTRARHDLAGGEFEHGGGQRGARQEHDERRDHGPQRWVEQVLAHGDRADARTRRTRPARGAAPGGSAGWRRTCGACRPRGRTRRAAAMSLGAGCRIRHSPTVSTQ